MSALSKTKVGTGIYYVQAPDANLRVLCGCPPDCVKHLTKRGLITSCKRAGTRFETGPNAILLSDLLVQNGGLANLAEFPVLQMLYMQGMIVPDHPNNTGIRPLLIGSQEQVEAQMRYIYRGNYGLDSREELRCAGVSRRRAEALMRLKLAFAFGRVRPSRELLDSTVVRDDWTPLRNGLAIRRVRLNVFEFRFRSEVVTVDLNLAPRERYQSPYALDWHETEHHDFAVVHSGNGNGWDPDRPAMSSILQFRGKVYLIDAEPNILNSLEALGIGVSEVEGVFHTHSHDDHFCGLPALMRTDHRIKYFATPIVRASAMKKLGALLSLDEDDVSAFFEIHDLKLNRWNAIEGLDVKPVSSPHPVETTVLFFRAREKTGHRSYAHLADTVSMNVLRGMVTDDDSMPGLTEERLERVRHYYLTTVDVKKIDIGGGLIHGRAEDFRTDRSGKLILAHVNRALTSAEEEIGSAAPFGSVDVLIRAQCDHVRDRAAAYLHDLFPRVPGHEVQTLLDSAVVRIEPGRPLLKAGECSRYVDLVLTGNVEIAPPNSARRYTLSAGALIGDTCAVGNGVAVETYRATSFVKVLRIPCPRYLEFVKRHHLLANIADLAARRGFLQVTWLFGAAMSYPVQNRIATAMSWQKLDAGQRLDLDAQDGVWLVRSGLLELSLGQDVLERVEHGDCVGETGVLFGTPALFQARAAQPTEVAFVPAQAMESIPIVRWKLLEKHGKRVHSALNPNLVSIPIFHWRDEYCTHVDAMDANHRELFRRANALYHGIETGTELTAVRSMLQFLAQYTETHFSDEEKLMRSHDFPGLGHHRREHRRLLDQVRDYQRRLNDDHIRLDLDFLAFLKDWVSDHILTEDRKYGPYLNERGSRTISSSRRT